MTPAKVLFVCTGNQYRSPIAERLFTARLGPSAEFFEVASAGTVAWPGSPMNARAAAVIRELGGGTDGFATRRLSADIVARSDVVLGLAREHREAAVRLHPTSLRRCFVLEEFVRLAGDGSGGDVAEVVARVAAARGRWPAAAPDADDIEDPDGGSDEVLRSCAARVERAVCQAAGFLSGVVRSVG